MKDRFKVGDKVKRKADQMDGWWANQCDGYNVKPDEIFQVVSHHGAGAINLKGLEEGFGYTEKYFELAEASEETKMQEAFALAKSLVGKTIVCNDGDAKYIVTGVIFRQDKTDDSGLGWSCNKFLKENGWLVGVKFNSMNYPVQLVKEVPTDIDVKLNGSYTATVSKGKVKIHGVTFPIEKIQEILDAHNKL